MAFIVQGWFKTCFIFLLLVAFIGLAFVNMYNISFEPSKVWLTSVGRRLHSFPFSINIQRMGNRMLIKQPPFLHHNQTAGEEILNTTHVVVTVTSGLNTTDSINQNVTMTSVPMTQHYHEAYPQNYHFIIDEPDICAQQKPFLVLMVPVAPQQLEARNAIRSTWGNESVVQEKKVNVLFILGLRGEADREKQQKQLSLESQKYHDLIQSNFIDTYNNLTTKTMVIMHWLATHCPQASYAMKIDSDMFLNLENLMSLLLAPDTPKENYMTGMVMWNRPVIRNRQSKWYVPKEMYPEDIYPPYLLGMGYVFSNDLSEKLVNVSKDIQPFYIEDAYVGACLKKLGLTPSNPPNPSQFKAYYNGVYKRSEFARVITTILSSPQQLVTFWQDLKRPT
ncbi:beta-1,3-galactosyltransferase 1 [Neoarius graeffei]|uniref:beta-1,3-galactosyltransferase 1 n=1 Tax=Neoarius graeffei TaxID=443677 RepID=UPI00298CCD18|nr:beta-1,3-galactosyltransferase 1 [Neoarius graeffei]